MYRLPFITADGNTRCVLRQTTNSLKGIAEPPQRRSSYDCYSKLLRHRSFFHPHRQSVSCMLWSVFRLKIFSNSLCNKNNKKYGILVDLAFEIVNVSFFTTACWKLLIFFVTSPGLPSVTDSSLRSNHPIHWQRLRSPVQVLQLLKRLGLLRASKAFRVVRSLYLENMRKWLENSWLWTAEAAIWPNETDPSD